MNTPRPTWNDRFLIAAACLVAASFAGFLHARSLDLRDQESFFYLTNSKGADGDFVARRLDSGDTVGSALCTGAATLSSACQGIQSSYDRLQTAAVATARNRMIEEISE